MESVHYVTDPFRTKDSHLIVVVKLPDCGEIEISDNGVVETVVLGEQYMDSYINDAGETVYLVYNWIEPDGIDCSFEHEDNTWSYYFVRESVGRSELIVQDLTTA